MRKYPIRLGHDRDLTAVGSFKDSIPWESVSKVIFIKLP